jgi:hypothetical protein
MLEALKMEILILSGTSVRGEWLNRSVGCSVRGGYLKTLGLHTHKV